ncbi:PAS domain-containing sensor histidine kinase [Lacibacter luteus]|uniref:histidine kinase n=1 Tax=Lacibacter luteus TaxID=2508719 RepID=A0A4Q1CPE2_9BACT|nr:PAS domain-containing sensor histidine kinase [Lacibacter luteus]RXK62655.1 PAS domain-containing sensor histidine kinase [Lacibacter luteus]
MQSIAEAKLFQTLFDHASIGIILVNAEATIISVNQFGVAQFGYGSKDEILGQKIELLIPARFHHRHVRQREHYMHEPKSRPMGIGLDLFAIKKDGSEFPVEVSLGNYEVENEFFVVAFVNDITARKKAEHALLQLNEELEQKVEARTISLQETVHILNEKIEEIEEKDKDLRAALSKERELGELKSRFVSVASHEFRTPLSTVLSSVYLLQKYTSSEDQPKREKHIQRIISSVNLLTDILNDFLNVGKIEEGKIQARFSQFDLEKNLSDTISEMQSMCKVGQRISYIHTGNKQVELDPGMFKHISLNLLSNAIKFSPENSEIVLATTVTGSTIEMRIKDSGIGISQEDQEHLFERFFRAANAINIQGTGLGLHIVSKYADLMNGKIVCNSEADKGTEFIITFQKRSAQ